MAETSLWRKQRLNKLKDEIEDMVDIFTYEKEERYK